MSTTMSRPRHARPSRVARYFGLAPDSEPISNVRVIPAAPRHAADSVSAAPTAATAALAASPRCVAQRAAQRQARYSDAVLFDPITRVEWDAFQAAGRDAAQWYDRLPASQRRLPEGVVRHGGTRFRVGANVTVVRGR